MRKGALLPNFADYVAAVYMLVFLYTGINKLWWQHKFYVVLVKSPLLNNNAAFISWFIPVLEIALFCALFFPQSRRPALVASVGLMAVFTAYIGFMLFTASSLPCSCGGILGSLNWTQHLVFNTMLLALGLLALFQKKHSTIYCNKQA
ncbi:MauE/DoxX family redox-associated membrane protein [Flavihumibacter sp. CACIAM 22H1]|uniref:MauE/DoxX family redox-associated membrane protein n=1 Tax=Flavihumibacter sp. CACIAM 22H1 TaxID=1812911 RepID=UPI000AB42700|nr:MauE/DoxX family redox-associated membrane protein [Flavihumibacter sp. CACIAM 22H1]